MAQVIYKDNNQIWVFSSRQMGGFKAFVNMLKESNDPLEEMVKLTVKEATDSLPDGAKVEDVKVETSDLNGPVINVVVKASISS